METVLASCPECGDIELTTKDVTCISFEFPAGREISQFRFRCPIDRKIVVKQADPRTIDRLIASGVSLKYIEMNEPDKTNVPGQFSVDEYLDIRDDWYTEQFDIEVQRLERDS